MRIALKYCGSCNPSVDLTRIARHLAQLADGGADFELVPLSDEPVDVLIILCGCRRACGDKEEVRTKAKHSLLVAGETVEGKEIPEELLPAAVEQELRKFMKRSTGGP